MVTSRKIRSEIELIFTYLYERDLATWWNPFDESPNRVTWKSRNDEEKFLTIRQEPSVKTYLKWLNDGQYSIMLKDGSLIQISYDLERNIPIGHRLAYIPCPYTLNWELFDPSIALADFVRIHATSDSDVLLRAAIRFDYDPSLTPGHPESHLTLNNSNCRIACASPLRVGRFFHFVFQNFYPEIYNSHEYLRDMPRDGWFTHTITNEHRQLMHLYWPRQAGTI